MKRKPEGPRGHAEAGFLGESPKVRASLGSITERFQKDGPRAAGAPFPRVLPNGALRHEIAQSVREGASLSFSGAVCPWLEYRSLVREAEPFAVRRLLRADVQGHAAAALPRKDSDLWSIGAWSLQHVEGVQHARRPERSWNLPKYVRQPVEVEDVALRFGHVMFLPELTDPSFRFRRELYCPHQSQDAGVDRHACQGREEFLKGPLGEHPGLSAVDEAGGVFLRASTIQLSSKRADGAYSARLEGVEDVALRGAAQEEVLQ